MGGRLSKGDNFGTYFANETKIFQGLVIKGTLGQFFNKMGKVTLKGGKGGIGLSSVYLVE